MADRETGIASGILRVGEERREERGILHSPDDGIQVLPGMVKGMDPGTPVLIPDEANLLISHSGDRAGIPGADLNSNEACLRVHHQKIRPPGVDERFIVHQVIIG